MLFGMLMVHGSFSVISLKENKFQTKRVKSKMLSDLTSTSDVTLSGKMMAPNPIRMGFECLAPKIL